MRARRLRSTSATTTRCVGTPWRESWFLAVISGVHQITLPRNPKVCDCPRRSANARLRAARLCSSVRKNEVRAGRGSRSRGFRHKTGERAPAQRTSSTFLSPAARTRLWKALPHSNRSRSISGAFRRRRLVVARPRRARALKRTQVLSVVGSSPCL